MLKRFALCLAVALLASPVFALDLGDKIEGFSGTNATDGKTVSMEDFKDSDVVVVCFTCNRCPVAVAYEDRFISFADKYKEKGVKFVAINVNGDTQEAMATRVEEKGISYPYIADTSQDSARAFGAKVTPHLFVLNKDRELVYSGAFDDSFKSAATKHYVADAVDAALAGKTPELQKTRPAGCGIRLKRQ